MPPRAIDPFRAEAAGAGIPVTEIGVVTVGEGASRFLDEGGRALAFARPSFNHF